MRVLFDQGTPVPLRWHLSAHSVTTADEMGWSALGNGELMAAAESQFDAFITTDTNLRYQQKVTGRNLAIIVLPSASWPKLLPLASEIAASLDGLGPGEYLELPGSV